MDEKTYKSLGWKDTTKRDRTPTWQWVRKMVNKAYTQEQWVDMFKALPDTTKWKILQDMNPVPKENVVKSEGSVQVIFNLEGVRRPKELKAEVIDMALPGHANLDDDDD